MPSWRLWPRSLTPPWPAGTTTTGPACESARTCCGTTTAGLDRRDHLAAVFVGLYAGGAMSQTPYEYVRISEGLLQRMTGLLRQGKSFGLLGPRNAGKRYVLRRLWDLCQPFATGIGVVPFLT